MPGLSSAGEAAVLAPLTTTAYVSLHTADPGNTGTSEVSGGAYARVGPAAFVNTGSNPTVASNSALLSFPSATAGWGAITYFGLWSAATAGTFLGSGFLSGTTTVNNGDTTRFLVGSLTITAQ
jgi:hypothetical protein